MADDVSISLKIAELIGGRVGQGCGCVAEVISDDIIKGYFGGRSMRRCVLRVSARGRIQSDVMQAAVNCRNAVLGGDNGFFRCSCGGIVGVTDSSGIWIYSFEVKGDHYSEVGA